MKLYRKEATDGLIDLCYNLQFCIQASSLTIQKITLVSRSAQEENITESRVIAV